MRVHVCIMVPAWLELTQVKVTGTSRLIPKKERPSDFLSIKLTLQLSSQINRGKTGIHAPWFLLNWPETRIEHIRINRDPPVLGPCFPPLPKRVRNFQIFLHCGNGTCVWLFVQIAISFPNRLIRITRGWQQACLLQSQPCQVVPHPNGFHRMILPEQNKF